MAPSNKNLKCRVKNYEPICVPKYKQASSHELSGLFNRITPNRMCLTDSQFENMAAISLEDIRNFLIKNESFLRTTIPDVDGIKIDPAQIIYDASKELAVNPQVILTTLQKEHSAITSKVRLDREDLRIIMGFDTQNPTTIRQQVYDAAAQFRRDFDKITNGIPTITGWLVGKTKASEDPVSVTPESRAVALLFSYTPWVGQYWAELGGRTGIGGNGLFCAVWAKIDFPIPPQSLALNLPSNITATSLKLSWGSPIFPDPDIVSYKIFRSTQPNITATSTLVALITDISQTFFTDTNLNPNTTYFYKIFVFDQDNLSTPSNEVSATTLPFIKPSPWPMFQHDVRHTGQSEYIGSQTGKVKWRLILDGKGFSSSPVIGIDASIYVGGSDGKLYVITSDGSLKWTYKISDYWIHSTPAVAFDGTIYIGSKEGILYAINSDGTLKWNYSLPGEIFSSLVIGIDGTIYVGTGHPANKLYAVNPDGTLKWSYETGSSIYSSPALSLNNDAIYVGSTDYKLYALNPEGTLKWSYSTGKDINSSPAVASDGTIYIGSDDYKLYAINPDGTLKWSYYLGWGYPVRSTPAIGPDGTIYITSGISDRWYLYAISPDGVLKWKYRTYGYLPSAVIGLDGTIYVGGRTGVYATGKFYAISSDGNLKWSISSYIFAPFEASAAIDSDGTVCIGTLGEIKGYFYAFRD